MLDYAKEVGVYVIARPGPYCNAETNAGGFALWGSDGSMGTLRQSDATFEKAWQPVSLHREFLYLGSHEILFQEKMKSFGLLFWV